MNAADTNEIIRLEKRIDELDNSIRASIRWAIGLIAMIGLSGLTWGFTQSTQQSAIRSEVLENTRFRVGAGDQVTALREIVAGLRSDAASLSRATEVQNRALTEFKVEMRDQMLQLRRYLQDDRP